MDTIFKQFFDKWADESLPPKRYDEKSISNAEANLGTRFPDIFRQFLNKVGKIWVPGILSSVVAQEAELPSLQDFLSPDEIIEVTSNWVEAGMPSSIIAFATDAMGNCLCFQRLTEQVEDSPVFLWDHDSNEANEAFSSFLGMIQSYIVLEKTV